MGDSIIIIVGDLAASSVQNQESPERQARPRLDRYETMLIRDLHAQVYGTVEKIRSRMAARLHNKDALRLKPAQNLTDAPNGKTQSNRDLRSSSC